MTMSLFATASTRCPQSLTLKVVQRNTQRGRVELLRNSSNLTSRQSTNKGSSLLSAVNSTHITLRHHSILLRLQGQQRGLSTATTTATSTASSAESSTKPPPKVDDSNVFLDNLGAVFLGGIVLVVGALIRSYMGTSQRNKMREKLTEEASLDPLEIDDLREANSELDLQVYQTILNELVATFGQQQSITYTQFVQQVRKTMRALKGDAFTIQLGHLLDRVVLDVLAHQQQTSADPQPIALWMTILSLTLYSPVPERVRALFQVLQVTSPTEPIVCMKEARAMVGYLQSSNQLVPESQVVATPQKYPIQKYAKGKPEDLFEWDGAETDEIDVDAFADVLRSSAVCAWGECYHRKKN